MPGFLSEENFWEEEGGSALLQTNTHSFVSGDKRDGYSNDVDNDDHFPVTSSSFIRPCLRCRLPGARLGRSVRWHTQRNSRQFPFQKCVVIPRAPTRINCLPPHVYSCPLTPQLQRSRSTLTERATCSRLHCVASSYLKQTRHHVPPNSSAQDGCRPDV